MPYRATATATRPTQARAEPGETDALPASHAVDRPEDEEGDRDPFDPDGRDPGHPREVRPPARRERERADDEQHHHRVVVAATAEVEREQRIPAHECRSERGTGGKRRGEDRGAEHGNRGDQPEQPGRPLGILARDACMELRAEREQRAVERRRVAPRAAHRA